MDADVAQCEKEVARVQWKFLLDTLDGGHVSTLGHVQIRTCLVEISTGHKPSPI